MNIIKLKQSTIDNWIKYLDTVCEPPKVDKSQVIEIENKKNSAKV